MIRMASPSVYVAGNPGATPRRADSPMAFVRVYGRRRLRGGSISPAAVSALAAAIKNQEGYYPGSLAYTNNNPGNLVYAGQPGASPGAGGFAYFQTPQAGEAALENQITLDATRGTDVNGNPITTGADLITSWAPPNENDTSAYITSVENQTGFDMNAPLASLGSPALIDAPSLLDSSSSAGFSFPDLTGNVDLSSIGISESVPTVALIGAGVLTIFLLSRLA